MVVAFDGDELPVGGFDPAIYEAVRLVQADVDRLTPPLWLGRSRRGAARLGAYLERPSLREAEEERVLTLRG